MFKVALRTLVPALLALTAMVAAPSIGQTGYRGQHNTVVSTHDRTIVFVNYDGRRGHTWRDYDDHDYDYDDGYGYDAGYGYDDDYDDGVVEAPYTRVETRGRVIVDAPYAHVYVGRGHGVHVRAPFVNLWVPGW